MSDRGVMFQYFEWNLPADGSLWRELASRAVPADRRGAAEHVVHQRRIEPGGEAAGDLAEDVAVAGRWDREPFEPAGDAAPAVRER